ncbi:MAG: hypothetical protein HKO06_10760 [Pseudomonadales bacterium]|nr:hypothetical protein [Pseudomonadales bacterium]
MLHKIAAWSGAVLLTYIIAAALVSPFNMASIEALGMQVPAASLLAAAWHDVFHMADLYLPIIAVALLIAFPFAAWLAQRTGIATRLLYPLAGFTALLTIHASLYLAFGMSPIAATREWGGLLAQGLAGVCGGIIFYWLLQRRTA